MTRLAAGAVAATAEAVAEPAIEGRDAVSRYLRSVEKAIAAAADELGRDGYRGSAERLVLAKGMMSRARQGVAGYDIAGLADEATAFARRNPAVALGLAVAAGYALVRFADSGRRTAATGGR